MRVHSFNRYLLLSFGLLLVFCGNLNASVAPEPLTQTTNLTATSSVCNEIFLTFTPGDGAKRIVVACANAPVSSFPLDAHVYTAGSLFGTGSDLGNGNYVVYNQSGSTVSVTGLQGGTQYYFAVFEYNGTLTGTNYLLTGYPEANAFALGFTMTVSTSSPGICNGDSLQLQAHGADTYQWTPSTALSSDTDSTVWAKPSGNISYTVVGTRNSSGCTNSRSVSITVYQLPNVTVGSFPDRCINANLYSLGSGNPSGGTYSGDGITNNLFSSSDAGLGQHVVTYSYTDIHNCTSSDTSNITVVNTPNVTLAAINDVCINASSFLLNGGSPSGGSYSGTGVSSGRFYPVNAGVGQHVIRYIYSNTSGCSDTAERIVNVRPRPNVVFSNIPSACLNTPPITLTQGTPSGGIYSGNGVSNNEFTPQVTGAGTFLITYNYTDSFGCGNFDTSYITIRTIPSVSFSALNSVCQNTGPVVLSGGSPSGGVYSGNAVGSGIFYTGIAGPGIHAITYSYTDNFSCTNMVSRNITVNAIPYPNLGVNQTVCSNESAFLTAGTYSSYAWSTGANTSSITVDTTGHGLGTYSYILTVTNNFGCANRDTVSVTFDGCVDVGELSAVMNNSFVVYPNPSHSLFAIYTKEKSDLFIYDITGALILEKKNILSGDAFGEDLSPGTYLLKIKCGQNVFNKRIIKN